ncbi:MAG: hypothetical protein H6R26_2894 [Proteobacteria bacterium]|nr:hypothetical protein [Pseudomonadota bacterium]
MQASVPKPPFRLLFESADPVVCLSGATDLRFTLERWCLCQPTTVADDRSWPSGRVLPMVDGAASLDFLPMMQRRRLSPLARAAIAVAWDCRGDFRELPAVFFSRHGESHYYFNMLCDLAESREISPSRFSLSVHNAVAGLYSLCSDTRAPCTVLAGGKEDFYGAFLEAAGLLLEKSCERVLVVWYEQPLPEVYRSYVHGPDLTLALGMRLSAPSEAGPQIELTRMPRLEAPDAECLLQDFCRAIVRGERSSTATNGAPWAWTLTDG